jgi:endogenous inhibitor of DNA gyrase (YacG/DUF329 family)
VTLPPRACVEQVPDTACAYCGGPLSRYVVSERDGFCSSVCAKTAHGVSLTGSAAPPRGRPRAYARKAKRAA